MMPQRQIVLADLGDRFLDRARDVDARAFGVRCSLAAAAAQADGARELRGETIDLRLRPFGPPNVVEAARLLELGSQLAEAAPVRLYARWPDGAAFDSKGPLRALPRTSISSDAVLAAASTE
jgi:hypothetical protein